MTNEQSEQGRLSSGADSQPVAESKTLYLANVLLRTMMGEGRKVVFTDMAGVMPVFKSVEQAERHGYKEHQLSEVVMEGKDG